MRISCTCIFLCLFLSSSSWGQTSKTEILWDEWGVPHIYAPNEEEAFFAMGWSHMHNHTNLILELYGKARGRGAEYWGEDYLEEDQIVHTLRLPELAAKWWTLQSDQQKMLMRNFVGGMNAYAQAHPDDVQEDMKQVLPLNELDLNMHTAFVVYTRFVGGQDLGMVQQWSDKGSNAYAIAPSRSASGNAMLVQNPHLPWGGEFTWHEMHIVTPEVNLYGVNIAGFPGIAIGFNENLGWTHTDNTIDNADTYELDLQDGGYLLDGVRQEFSQSQATIKVKQEDGSMEEQTLPLLASAHGPVVRMGETKALAVRLPGYDRPNLFAQWWNMATANNLIAFEDALKMSQIPFWNVIYADKVGNILYLFNGQVPVRSEDSWDYWNRIIPGGKSEDIWTSVHPYKDLPRVLNPPSGWLQNANDPPWYCTFPQQLDPANYPGYMAPTGMRLRPQRSARMVDQDESITFDELVSYKLSTRIELADRILDDLEKAVAEHGNESAKEALEVLKSWDRKTDADSKGAFLFTAWAQNFGFWSNSKYAQPYDEDNPRTTPDGLANPEEAAAVLGKIADAMKEAGRPLDIAWGETYRIKYGDLDLPGNGSSGGMGVFRVAWPEYSNQGITYIGGGDSWQGIIEFGDRINAKVLVSYGNSSEKDSPHYGDQLKLFAEKKFRTARMYRTEVEKHMKWQETRSKSGFQKQ